MTRKFPPGKVPWDRIAEKVHAQLPPEVLLGPALGEDAALVRIGSDIWTIASDPITFTSKDCGRLSVIVNANDVAVKGAKPMYYITTVLVSPEDATEEHIGEILDDIQRACQELDVALIGGHTEVTPGLANTIIAGTMLGRVLRSPITTGGLREGNLIGMTKWAGIEGTTILLKEFEERLREMHGPEIFLETSKMLGKNSLSIVPEATLAASSPFVTSLHDVTEGGVGEAIYELAGASGLSIHIDTSAIPVLPATRILCADFGMNPFGLIGSGSLLIGCAPEGKAHLERSLSELGIPFAWIGHAETASNKPASTLPRFERDELLKAWLLQDLEACVFDMDGTIIDSDYDWQAIRAALGVNGLSILDDLHNLKGEEKEMKWAKLHQIEQDATLRAHVKPNASDLLSLLAEKGIKTALVTNNSAQNVSYLLEKFGLTFDTIVTRDSGLYKPSGAPIAEAVRRLDASLERTLCIGDSAYDIMACRDSGCRWACILFDTTARVSPLADLDFPDIQGLIRYLKIVL
ncbi:MAG: hypothetical protein Kow0099_34780 [Candidatus Abyssubacteria bacterium]